MPRIPKTEPPSKVHYQVKTEGAETLLAALELTAALQDAYGTVFTVGHPPLGEVKYFVNRKPIDVKGKRFVVTVRNENKGVNANQFILEFGIEDEKEVPVFCKVKPTLTNTRTGEKIEGQIQPPKDYEGYKDLITINFDSIPSGTYSIDFVSSLIPSRKFKNS